MPREELMMKPKLKTLLTRSGLGAFLIASWLHAHVGHAKLDVPYGPDGSPPDSKTQQEVDDYNELLDGPKDGQSYDDWAAALDAAHDVLFGDDAPTELETASSGSSSNGDGDCNVPPEVPGNDSAETP